jgi:hypothetical protein
MDSDDDRSGAHVPVEAPPVKPEVHVHQRGAGRERIMFGVSKKLNANRKENLLPEFQRNP